MDDELIYDEDRLTGRSLTPEEVERLRQHTKKAAAFARDYFKKNPPRGRDVDEAR